MRKIITATMITASMTGSAASACEYDYATAIARAKESKSLLLVGQGGHDTVVDVIAKLRAIRPEAGTTALDEVLHSDAPYREDATESAMFMFVRDPSQSILFFSKMGCVVQIVRIGPFGVMPLDPAKYALQPF